MTCTVADASLRVLLKASTNFLARVSSLRDFEKSKDGSTKMITLVSNFVHLNVGKIFQSQRDLD